MDFNKLLLFMGTERSGIYALVRTFGAMKLPCGFPIANLRNPLAVRHMPPYPQLWYWSAIRRIFEELGLPAVAEIPEDRVSPEERSLFVRTIARCLQKHLITESFLCGDHLTALVLPFVKDAIAQINATVQPYLFFTHPAREITILEREQGQPAALTEFMWRNTLVAALRHAGEDWRILDADSLNGNDWQALTADIVQTLRPGQQCVALTGLPAQEPLSSQGTGRLSAQTRRLYALLRDHVAGKVSLDEVRSAAQEMHALQMEQNGWQYVGCLDCGTLHQHAQRLLAQAEPEDEHADDSSVLLPDTEQGWLALLEEMEQKLLSARRDYDTALFLHSDSLHRHYMHLLEDERQLCATEIAREKAAARQRSRRHTARVRAVVERFLQRESNR